MVKASDLIAGQKEYVTTSGTKVILHSLCTEDILKGIEQIQAEMSKKSTFTTLIEKMAQLKRDPTSSEAIQLAMAGAPLMLKLTDMIGSACGKDGKWAVRLPLFDLLSIVKEITALTRPAETIPLFFELFRTWKGAFQAMTDAPEA